MNGVAVAERMRQYPPDSLSVAPYPDGRSVWDYSVAVHTTQRLEAASGDSEQITDILADHIFARHPMILDLPPAVLHRYQQAKKIAEEHGSTNLLSEKIVDHFELAATAIREGHTWMITHSTGDPDLRPELLDGQWKQKLWLPPSIQQRSLAWNAWVQGKVKAEGLDELFSTHPGWHMTKIAEGSLLPVGNLNIEVVQGLARTRRAGAKGNYIEEVWELPAGKEYGSGLDLWFAMSHIVEKDLLKLAAEVGPEMVDGLQLTPEIYAKSYARILEVMDLNPQLDIQGVLSDGTWAYSHELARLFPDQHIAKLHDIAGKVIELGTAEELGVPEQVAFATGNARRRAAYQAGEYSVGIAARFIDRPGMAEVLDRFGLTAN